MVQLQRHAMQQAMQRADRALLRLNAQSPQARLDLLRRRQLDLGRRLHAASTSSRSAVPRACAMRRVLRGHHPQRQLDAMQRRLAALRGRPQAAMQRLLERDALRLRGLARSLEAVSPLATVARGYSILTRSDDGTLVRVDQVQSGDALQARVGDGVIDVQVK
jgi:exodeoxyribonuclease VII large subunit